MSDARRQIRAQYAAADQMASALARPSVLKPDLISLEDALRSCQRWHRRLEKSRLRGWRAARLDSRDRLRGVVEQMRQRIEMISGELGRADCESMSLSTADIYREIESLHSEFDSVAIKRSTKQLRVRTDEIVLDGVYLGRFDVVLRWDRIVE